MQFNIHDTFNKKLPADLDLSNTRRQVFNACYSFVIPKATSNPQLIHVADEVAKLLGISKKDYTSTDFLQTFTGNKVTKNTNPYAMCYGGHQFGNWAGQLGDGRAINLMEIEHQNKRWALQLKGAGETPYSRTADGLAVLRSSIREHLCSEAMHYLGIPTTRSLSLALSGDQVLRDILYDGNSAYEKGAIVCRTAPSFIRFGNFEIFASRNDKNTLKTLLDYTITEFYPTIQAGTKEGYLDFFNTVVQQTLHMIIHWQRVGFVHGVMNTDNMSILGLTIDYGPYGWLEGYDHNWTPNTTDRQFKRYSYGNQPKIGLWNLYQLANALFPLIEDAKPLEEALNNYNTAYKIEHYQMMRNKLGLIETLKTDEKLIDDLERILQLSETDMTLFFRSLASISKSIKIDDSNTFLTTIQDAFYAFDEIKEVILKEWKEWFSYYIKRLEKESLSDLERKDYMNKINPKYVLRNYMAQLAIDAADKGDYSLLNELYELLKNPYEEQPEHEKWFAKRPEWARKKVGCSMLSCSS
ncbi:UPF0061 protein [Flavobacteriaceae bacterium UJ101]|nr:UPF0061 protein [Flavobacteriaceae bacterium UJ101]